MTLSVSDGVVRGVLLEELDGRGVDLSLSPQAPAAALELLQSDRKAWPAPRDSWETLVLAVAMAVHRLRGRGIKDRDLVPALHRVLASLTPDPGLAS